MSAGPSPAQMPTAVPDPFAMALRYATTPYARGIATLALGLGPAVSGASKVLAYDFSTFQTQYGLQPGDVVASYVLTLRADQLSGPAVVDIEYTGSAGAGSVQVIIPAGTLAGASFALAPLPNDSALVLQNLTEHPIPSPKQPSGPNKWALTALLGNGARLLSVLAAEPQLLAATARDTKAQYQLATARAASLDRIGDGLGVPRQLPAPYRLDFDPDTIALYHFDDPIAPVIDATHDYPGVNVGASRGVPGRFNSACQITSSGGIIIPDALAFAIDPASGFTVEMFANLAAPPAAQQWVVFAVKRPRLDQSADPGWSLALEPSAGGHDLAFTLTDSAGVVIRAAAANLAPPAGWFHVAGVVNPVTAQAAVYLNGQPVGTAPLGAVGVVNTGANIGLGADLNGAAHLTGSLDELRFSNVARTDFSSVLGPNAQPYLVDGQTIALYHLDETDDWIDEDRSTHFAINNGAQRGIPARFNNGLRFSGDPLANSRCPAESDFQNKLRTGSWDGTAGAAAVQAGPYARFGYRQGAISEPGLDGALHPVIVNDQAAPNANSRGLVTTACYGFTPDDPTNTNDPSQTIAKFQAAGRSVQEAIDYFGEWHGLPDSFFTAQYQAHGVTAAYETCLPANSTPTSVTIPGAAEFALDATTSFTVEAFIKPDPVAADYARAIVASRSSGLRGGEANANEAGWGLCLGPYHSIPNNLRWVLGDATGTLVTVDADINLADGVFHHIAGVVDRNLGAALLYVDGIEVHQTPLGDLGPSATNGQIVLGNSPALTAPYAGLLDEVRISRAALNQFQPVLGESDVRYRQRLAVFQPWRLPVYSALKRGVQALTLSDPTQVDITALLLGNDPIPSDLVQLDVDETDSTRFCASQWFRIIPEALAPGQTIAVDGTTPSVEPSVAGLAPLPANSPALLSEPDGANYTFATPASRWMVLATAQALERFAARVAVVAPAATLSIASAYTAPAAPTSNDNLGRALTMVLVQVPSGFDLGMLGALAFAMGFAYVAYENSSSPRLRLVVAPGDDLELGVISANPPGLDPFNRQIAIVNQPIIISVIRPTPTFVSGVTPPLEWSVLPCGPAAAALTPATANSVTFIGTALGSATVTVRYTLADGVTVLVGSLPIVIAPQTLEGCGILGGDGTSNVTEASASGLPDPDFRTDYLISSTDTQVDFTHTIPPAPASNLMQLPLQTALNRLAALAAHEPGAPRITVLAAYDPNAANLQAVGRGMVLVPSSANLTAARLGALAFLVGFSYIERRRYPASVYVSVPQGNRFEIVTGPLKRLWPDARISGRGKIMATEFAAAGPPDPNFVPAMLQPFVDPRASFAPGVSNEVQPSLAISLSALLDALAADGAAGVLQVIAGNTPQDPTLLGVGRAVLVQHASVGPDRLCGYALQAGFGFVQYRAEGPGGPAVYMAAYPVVGAPPNLLSSANAVPAVAHTTTGTAAAADVQTLSINGNPIGGWFTLAFNNQATAVRYNATAAQVQAALTALPNIGANNLICTGGPLPGAITITFAAALAPGPQPLILICSNNLVGPPDPNANYVNLYTNAKILPTEEMTPVFVSQLGMQPQLAVRGQLDWGLKSACPAAAVLSTAWPDPSDKPGIHEEIVQGTAAGAVAAVATFSLRDFSDPYQFRVLPSAVAGGGAAQEPRLTKSQYDDLLNFLDAYHPVGVEAITARLRAFVHGFARPLRWDRLPTARTFPRYRVNR
jgi:Concanavalin A-like lectin/glucanases superfamily